MGIVKPSSDPSTDFDVEQETNEEVEKSWLRGPFTAVDMDSRHDFWLPARRFGVRQGNKPRCIDDYSLFDHNAAALIPDKADLRGADMVVGVCRTFGLGDGVHPSYLATGGLQLVGKTWDPASAYRQLARAPRDACLAVIATVALLGAGGVLRAACRAVR